MKTNPNDPAFIKVEAIEPPLTKREIFAKDFTAALLANPNITNFNTDEKVKCMNSPHNIAIEIADALIQELNEGKKENKND